MSFLALKNTPQPHHHDIAVGFDDCAVFEVRTRSLRPCSVVMGPFRCPIQMTVSKRREDHFHSRNGRPTERSHHNRTGPNWVGGTWWRLGDLVYDTGAVIDTVVGPSGLFSNATAPFWAFLSVQLDFMNSGHGHRSCRIVTFSLLIFTVQALRCHSGDWPHPPVRKVLAQKKVPRQCLGGNKSTGSRFPLIFSPRKRSTPLEIHADFVATTQYGLSVP